MTSLLLLKILNVLANFLIMHMSRHPIISIFFALRRKNDGIWILPKKVQKYDVTTRQIRSLCQSNYA